METPNILRGYFYPSSRISRCPQFHPCIATKKCQNYNKHCLLCTVCESRVNIQTHLGGYVPEGTYFPDLQHSLAALQKLRNMTAGHVDREAQKINPTEITNKYAKAREAADKLAFFHNLAGTTMEEKIIGTYRQPENRHMLGRLK